MEQLLSGLVNNKDFPNINKDNINHYERLFLHIKFKTKADQISFDDFRGVCDQCKIHC